MKFASHYNPPDDVRLSCPEASLTLQEYADEVNLNKIMDRYARGMGSLPVRDDTPFFGDFTDVPDYQTAIDMIQDAQSRFEDLPSDLRAKFANNPRKLVDFVLDGNNRDKAVEYGLIPASSPAPAIEAHKPSGGSADA